MNAFLSFGFKKPFILASIFSVFTVILFYAIFGIYFESSEKWVALVVHGNFTVPPYGIWFTDNHFLQIPVLATLASCFQTVPIYGIWHLGITILILWLWFFACIRIVMRKTEDFVWVFLLVVPFVWLFLGTSIVHTYFMRSSILLASVSLLLFLDFHFNQDRYKFIFIIIFFLACSMRVSSSCIVLGFFTFFILLCLPNKKQLAKMFILPWGGALICLAAVLLYKTYSGNTGAKIDQVIEYAISDRGALNPISMASTAEDSMRYRAVTEFGIITDSANITISFIKRLMDDDKLQLMSLNQYDIDHFIGACFPWIEKNKLLLALIYMGLFIMALGQPYKIILHLILLHISGWGVIFFIGMKVSMYDYFIEPWLAMLFVISYFLLLRLNDKPLLLWKKTFSGLILLSGFITVSSTLHKISLLEREYNTQVNNNLEYLAELTKTTHPIIWSNLSDYPFFPSNAFSRNNAEVFYDCEYFGLDLWGYYPFAQKRFIQRFGCSPLDWKCMNYVFQRRSNDISFVMEERMASFLPQYYKLLYGLEFKLERDLSKREILPGLFIYKLL